MMVYICRDNQKAPEHYIESFPISTISNKNILKLEKEIQERTVEMASGELFKFVYENNL